MLCGMTRIVVLFPFHCKCLLALLVIEYFEGIRGGGGGLMGDSHLEQVPTRLNPVYKRTN